MKSAQGLLAAAAGLLNTTFSLDLFANTASPVAIHEAPYVHSYFYVGGHYVDDGSGYVTMQDQIYVEKLTPAHQTPLETPIILIHGQGQTGSNFLNKPDGGRGWASLFTSQGYEVYIVDQSYRGRSPWQPADGEMDLPFSVSLIEQYFTATQRHRLWPQAINHTQWPGTGERGDAIFDTFYAANVQYIADQARQQLAVQKAGAALLDRIGRPAIILGHSQGSAMPPLIADVRPELAKALVLVEPVGPPFQEVLFKTPNGSRPWGLSDVPVTYSPAVVDPKVDFVTENHPPAGENLLGCVLQAEQPPPKKLVNLADTPILVVTAEASYHAQYDHCTVQFWRQAGCAKTEHLDLGRAGVHGNGHFIFLEKNSDEVYHLLEKWIANL